MRICLISREYPPDTGWGGVGAYTYQTAHALSRAGHDVEVVSLAARRDGQGATPQAGAHGAGASAGPTVHRVEWEDLLEELNLFLVSAPSSHFVVKSGIALWRKFLQLHARQPFDVVEAPEHLGAGVFHALTRIVPLVVTLHTPHSKFVSERFHGVLPSFDNQLICMLERISILSADTVCSPSRDLAGFVAGDTGISLGDVHIVRNPVDTTTFCPDGPVALEPDGRTTILFVGRLERRKGIHYLIEAVPRILEQVPDVRFVVVGADTNTAHGGASVLAELRRALWQSGCADAVTFLAHVPLSEIPSYYRSADICVVPSLYDNAPYTCIEALSCGRPVIASSAGGTREYLEESQCGIIVPPGSAEALATAVIELARDREKRRCYGDQARRYAEGTLSLDVLGAKKFDVYKTAIARYRDNPTRALYLKEARCSLTAALDLLCAYDRMLFDILSKQSAEFRLRYYWRFMKQRPKLFFAQAILSVARALERLTGFGRSSVLLERLESRVAALHSPPYEPTMSLGKLLERELESLPLTGDTEGSRTPVSAGHS